MHPFNPLTDLSLLSEILGLLIAAMAGFSVWLRARKAPFWQSTQGTVISTKTGPSQRRKWACHLTYSYAVNGEYYSGTHAIHARNEKQADEAASSWKSRSVMVRYAPLNHSTSVLLKDDQIGGLGN